MANDERRARGGRPPGARIDGDLMRQQRRERQLSREALARRAGLSVKTVQNAERGAPISRESVQRLCRALDVPTLLMLWPDSEQVRRRLLARGRDTPPPPRPWTPRAEEATLLAWLGAQAHSPCCITGPIGIGKTALAEHLVAAVTDRVPGGVRWVACATVEGEARADLVQLDLAEALGFASALPPLATVDRRGFDAAFRHHLWRRRCLLVLDDLVSRAFAEHFLAPGQRSDVLATTRFRHVAESFQPFVVELGGISDEDARRLLATELGEERLARDAAGTVRLLALLRGVPRSLRVAARVLARERLTSPGAYAARLEGLPASSLPIWVPTSDEPEPRDLTQLGNYLQVRGALSEAAWRLFGTLGVFGDRPFTPSWAAAAGGLEAGEAERCLSELANVFLVQPQALSPDGESLLRLDTHAAWLARGLAAEALEPAMERLVDHAIARAEALRAAHGPAALIAAFARHRPLWSLCVDGLVARLPVEPSEALLEAPGRLPAGPPVGAGVAEPLLRLVLALEPLLVTYRIPEGARWLAAALVATRSGPTGAVPARLLLTLTAWHVFADTPLSAFLAEAPALPERLVAEGDPLAAIGSCFLLANIAAATEGLPRQHQVHSRALEIARDIGVEGIRLAYALNRLGVVLSQTPSPSAGWGEADRLWDEAVRACASAGAGGEYVAAVCRANRALLRVRAGRPDGLPALEEALTDLYAALPEEYGLDRAQILAHAAHHGLSLHTPSPEDARALAASTWRLTLIDCPPEAASRQAFVLATGAFSRFILARRPQEREGLFSGGVCAHTFPTEPVPVSDAVPGMEGLELMLHMSLAATDPFFEGDLLDLAMRFTEAAHGRGSRAWLCLSAWAEMQAQVGIPTAVREGRL